ncbi:cytosine deaminase [Jannaschia sp. CCS1]|uniref:cytosine deaminase n=1 Tax=Jannaschia sp. (strain CCS1) TaxID=290400 RepID=UPI000053DAA3|nr:cytosine deaminase [Jannaschia sp. CCS1]ABD54391.1 Amidohydrolase 3 [Jannaschia sp. CCS1]
MDFKTLPSDNLRLENVTIPGCLIGQSGVVRTALSIADGVIAASGGTPVDMRGAMVFPCFVDMHTHLDKGHIWPRSPNPDGTFMGALETVRADKSGRWDSVDLPPRMNFSLNCAYAHGTRAIRTHLDYFGETDEARVSWDVFAQIRDDWAGRIDLQAAVLTGIDMAADAGALATCADLVASHGGALGAVTYPEPDLRAWLTAYFEAAALRGMDLDFHVDETMDPEVNTLKDIAEIVLETGFKGKITVGHLCSLSVMEDAVAMATLDLVAKAGLDVVSLPMCNLYLQDRHAARTPRGRGITLVHEMKARGINVSFASDNTRDPFYAYGDMDMIEVMREATRIGHLDHSDDDWTHAFLGNPARACGVTAPSLMPGAPADLVICRAREWTELFARPQADRIVLRDGRQIDRALPDYAELDYLMTPSSSEAVGQKASPSSSEAVGQHASPSSSDAVGQGEIAK